MLFIGNDIISFEDSTNQLSFSNQRFIRKILTENELSFFEQNLNHKYLPWLFWTCKESAYKIALKKGIEKSFAPQSYEVKLSNSFKDAATDNITGIVEFYGNTVFFNSKIHMDYISTIACSKAEFLDSAKSVVDVTYKTDHSKLAREWLSIQISSLLGIEKTKIEIYRNKAGVPFLNIANNNKLPDISFSHDGKFFSFAYLFTNLRF